MRIRKKSIENISFMTPILLALVVLMMVMFGSQQAAVTPPMPQSFVGEYSYDGENWELITKDSDISARRGDILLRGHFTANIHEGKMLWFYRNHIGVTGYINGELWTVDALTQTQGMEPRLFASMCAEAWAGMYSPGIAPEDMIEFRLMNPHRAGNDSAYRDFLSTMCVVSQGTEVLENSLEPYGKPYRIMGGIYVMGALVLLGIALASAVIRFQPGKRMFKLGLLVLFAGGFIYFDTIDISFQNSMMMMNTYAKLLMMMLWAVCLGFYLLDSLTGENRAVASAAMMVSALITGILIVLSSTGAMVIYDTLPYWFIMQALLCPLLILLCISELRIGGAKLSLVGCMTLLAAMLLDTAGAGERLSSAVFTKSAFTLLFIVNILHAAKSMVKNQQAAARAEKLEKELEESRIALMLSQIQPHFLYNVLGTIRGLCRENPEQAWQALGDFSNYLRGNMGALANKKAVHFTSELRHIEAYLSLEKMRMGERLNILYDIQYKDFFIAPLTVQPLVENAIKHGLFVKKEGGTLTLHTRREEGSVIIEVEDDGVGFDTENPVVRDEHHARVGLANVSSRVEKMSSGSLSVRSAPGEGTVVTVVLALGQSGMQGAVK